MRTKVKEVNVIDDMNCVERFVSIEEICQQFYGITTIHYTKNIHKNNAPTISVYTKNFGTESIEKLLNIKETLKANSISISIVNLIEEEFKGLIYILTY